MCKFGILSILLSLFLNGCVLTGSYQSPFLIGVSVNSEGQVNVGLAPSMSTPIGTFTLSGDTTVMSLRDIADKRLLIIRVDKVATVYTLEEGKKFKVEFKDDGKLYSQVNLVYETDGDIVLELETVNTSSLFPTSQPGQQPEISSTMPSQLTCKTALRNLQDYASGQTISGPATLHPFAGCTEMATQLELVCIGYWGINIKSGQSIVIPDSVTQFDGKVLKPPYGTFSSYENDSQLEHTQDFWLANCK